MKKLMMLLGVVVLLSANVALATIDTFGTGDNQFTIDFVNISGDTNPASGYGIVNNDYRMGTYEITKDQWNKYASSTAGTERPAVYTNWFEAAQFVNYLNTSTGNQAAYKFDGSTFSVWESGDVGYDLTNPYRNSEAFYFMPTEDEWVKAAYWNGTNLQTYATIDGSTPIVGTDTNYDDAVGQPWNVGSGSEELNGTFDMMGNVWEWMESPWSSEDYLSGSIRGVRGGSFNYDVIPLSSSSRLGGSPNYYDGRIGFRVASEVPEPCSLVLLSLGGLMLRRRRKA